MTLNPDKVNELHSYDDVDSSDEAHHHTLGRGIRQAAAGNHTHPFCRGRLLNATQAIPTSAWTTVDIIMTNDSHDIYDIVGNAIGFRENGFYEIDFTLAFDASAVGSRWVGIEGAFVGIMYQNNTAGMANWTFPSLRTIHNFKAGDSISFKAWQNSGGNLNILKENGFNLLSYYSIKKVGHA